MRRAAGATTVLAAGAYRGETGLRPSGGKGWLGKKPVERVLMDLAELR